MRAGSVVVWLMFHSSACLALPSTVELPRSQVNENENEAECIVWVAVVYLSEGTSA